MSEKILSVSEVNRSIKSFVEGSYLFKNMWIQGEISNITYYKSGHLYFTLKDDKASVKCAIFNYTSKGVPRDLQEGNQVKVRGNASIYEATGSYQIIVEELEKINQLGKLYEKLEELKNYYFEKGYFKEENKKRLPVLPMNIGVVTAHTGAAIRDIINTTHKRNPYTNIFLYPAKVQGEGASKEIAKGIEFFNKMYEENQLLTDVLIVGRGGGSIEDLWAFNEVEVIEAIYKSNIPIVSAVGHEIDNLLSDLVADKRAATPTQAAEILIPELEILRGEIKQKERLVGDKLMNKIKLMKRELEHKKSNYYIKNFKEKFIDEKRMALITKEENLTVKIKERFKRLKDELELKKIKLSKYSSEEILKQGYVLIKRKNKIITRGIEVDKGEILTIHFKDMDKKVVVK